VYRCTSRGTGLSGGSGPGAPTVNAMNPALHDPLKRTARFVTHTWCRRLTLLLAAYQLWAYRPAGLFVAAAVLCFRTGLVYSMVSLVAQACRWRIVPGVVLLAFTYTVGLGLQGQPVLDSPTKTHLALAVVIAVELGGHAYWWWKCRRQQLPRVSAEQLLWVYGRA
jgi:hypothetical protein